jgi:muramidase (phage lysozyme)
MSQYGRYHYSGRGKFANSPYDDEDRPDSLDQVQTKAQQAAAAKLKAEQDSARKLRGDCAVNAMLDTLSFSEHADYDTVVFGKVLKSPNDPSLIGKTNVKVPNYSQHPNILVQAGNWQSTAAGRYQFLNRTWNGLGLPDFTPMNQDIGAIMLMQRRGMITPLQSGDVQTAITNGNAEWASLPGSPYGQGTKPMNSLKNVYEQSLLRCITAMHEILQGQPANNGT